MSLKMYEKGKEPNICFGVPEWLCKWLNVDPRLVQNVTLRFRHHEHMIVEINTHRDNVEELTAHLKEHDAYIWVAPTEDPPDPDTMAPICTG